MKNYKPFYRTPSTLSLINKSKPRKNIESKEQIQVARWLKKQKEWGRVLQYTSIPNSTWTPSFSVVQRNKSEGLCAGLPDLLIILKEPRLLVFIEMKVPAPLKSVVSPEQIEWIENLCSVQNTIATVCYGAKEAISFLSNLIGDVSCPDRKSVV